MQALPVNVDHGPGILAVSWIECALGTIFVVLRMYCRGRITRNVSWDDWTMCFTFVSQTVSFWNDVAKLTQIAPRTDHHSVCHAGSALRCRSTHRILVTRPCCQRRQDDLDDTTILDL